MDIEAQIDKAVDTSRARDVDIHATPYTDYEIHMETREQVLTETLDRLGNEIEAMQSALEEFEAATDKLLKLPEGGDVWEAKLDRAEALGILKAHIISVVSTKRVWVGE